MSGHNQHLPQPRPMRLVPRSQLWGMIHHLSHNIHTYIIRHGTEMRISLKRSVHCFYRWSYKSLPWLNIDAHRCHSPRRWVHAHSVFGAQHTLAQPRSRVWPHLLVSLSLSCGHLPFTYTLGVVHRGTRRIHTMNSDPSVHMLEADRALSVSVVIVR